MANGQGKSMAFHPLIGSRGESAGRVRELDLLRGIGLLLMITYHVVWDLDSYTHLAVDHQSLIWSWAGTMAAVLFIGISGVCSGFSRNTAKRGWTLLGYGLGLTLITYIIMPEQYIRFGILHFLGICMLLSPLFKALSQRMLSCLAGLSLFLGGYLSNIKIAHNFFSPLGLTSPAFRSLDYFPLFPYLAYFLAGYLGYRMIWSKGMRLIQWDGLPGFRWLEELGRKSLFIYFLHQPVILLILWGMGSFL